MKSRIIVWSVVGIIVIIGVVVIATAPKSTRGPKVTPDAVKSEVAQAEGEIERLVARLAEGRKTIAPGADTSKVEEANRLLAEAREKLGQVSQAADVKEGLRLLKEARETLRKARRAVELAAKPKSRPQGMY